LTIPSFPGGASLKVSSPFSNEPLRVFSIRDPDRPPAILLEAAWYQAQLREPSFAILYSAFCCARTAPQKFLPLPGTAGRTFWTPPFRNSAAGDSASLQMDWFCLYRNRSIPEGFLFHSNGFLSCPLFPRTGRKTNFAPPNEAPLPADCGVLSPPIIFPCERRFFFQPCQRLHLLAKYQQLLLLPLFQPPCGFNAYSDVPRRSPHLPSLPLPTLVHGQPYSPHCSSYAAVSKWDAAPQRCGED